MKFPTIFTKGERILLLFLVGGAATGLFLLKFGHHNNPPQSTQISLVEQKIALNKIPTETVQIVKSENIREGNQKKKLNSPSEKIDINSAGEAKLILLPGVGPVMAKRIIETRNLNGPFSKPEDLLEVKGIGPAKLQKISPHIIVVNKKMGT